VAPRARSRAEQPFAAEVASLLSALPNARRHVCYSSPAGTDRRGPDFDTAGRLTADVLGGLALPRGAEAYLCGPTAFLHDVSAALVALGVEPSRIRTEIFGAQPSLTPGLMPEPVRAPHPPTGSAGDGPLVTFARSGLSVPWHQDYASLLELAEACDVPTRWSCRTGVSHNCESGLLAGTVSYLPDPVEDPAVGNVLICCARPRGELALDL
jgi:ferredoxin-NADP reductase